MPFSNQKGKTVHNNPGSLNMLSKQSIILWISPFNRIVDQLFYGIKE